MPRCPLTGSTSSTSSPAMTCATRRPKRRRASSTFPSCTGSSMSCWPTRPSRSSKSQCRRGRNSTLCARWRPPANTCSARNRWPTSWPRPRRSSAWRRRPASSWLSISSFAGARAFAPRVRSSATAGWVRSPTPRSRSASTRRGGCGRGWRRRRGWRSSTTASITLTPSAPSSATRSGSPAGTAAPRLQGDVPR